MKKNPSGDIEIKITGLRPGEKLYEELLIGNDPQKTNHPKILMTNDPFIKFSELEKQLIILKNFLKENNVNEVKLLLEKLIKSYKSNSNLVDHLYIEQISSKKYEQNISIIDNRISKNHENKKIVKFIN